MGAVIVHRRRSCVSDSATVRCVAVRTGIEPEVPPHLACDGDSAAESRRLIRVRWAAALSALVIGLNITMMNVAVADVRASFPTARFTVVGWVVSSYLIVFGGVLVPAGRIADLLGRRSVFMSGLALFGAGSIVAGAAPSLGVLIVGRVIQGVGAACLTPSSMALLLDATPVDQRAAATSFYTGMASLGTAGGPSIGAVLIDNTSWRAGFFLCVPVVAAAYGLGRRAVPASTPVRDARLPDVLGALMIIAAMTSLSFGITQGRTWGWTHGGVLGAFASSAVLVPLFLWRCAHHPAPVMTLGLFRRRSFATANLAGLLAGMASGAAGLVNVLFLRDVWGYSLIGAGFGALPSSLMAMSVTRTVGRVGVQRGEAWMGVPAGLSVAAAMVWLRLFADHDASYWTVYFPSALMLGFGVAATSSMISVAAIRGIGPRELSLASATNRTFVQLGSAIGIAAVFSVLADTKSAGALGDFGLAWVLLAAAGLATAGAVAVTGSTTTASRTHGGGTPTMAVNANR